MHLFEKRCQHEGCREIFITVSLDREYCDKHGGKEGTPQVATAVLDELPDELEEPQLVPKPIQVEKEKVEKEPIPEKPEKPKPGSHRDYLLALHSYYQTNREAILSDLAELGMAKTAKRWKMSWGTLIRMSNKGASNGEG